MKLIASELPLIDIVCCLCRRKLSRDLEMCVSIGIKVIQIQCATRSMDEARC